MNGHQIRVQGFQLQESPPVLCGMLPGNWLLQHSTPSWRIQDPIRGFQRIVRERRAREIALAVLDQQRTFPNSIILATDIDTLETRSGMITIPEDIVFLVVDGQHRLWAQKFSTFQATYACVIHMGMSEERMAKLFLEINDNQKRVPSSLRWDLVRLIQPDDDPQRLAAAEIVNMLATEEDSPFYQRIDLTGEQSEIQIKQGSLAPEFHSLLGGRSPIREYSFLEQHRIILEYSIAIRQIDPDRWGRNESPFFKARVLRSMFRLMSDVIRDLSAPDSTDLVAMKFIPYLKRIDEQSLHPDTIRAAQGSAGMRAIYLQLKSQVFPDEDGS